VAFPDVGRTVTGPKTNRVAPELGGASHDLPGDGVSTGLDIDRSTMQHRIDQLLHLRSESPLQTAQTAEFHELEARPYALDLQLAYRHGRPAERR
jgi:hypothetical protein